MVIRRGEIFWAELPCPRGSEPGYRRPVLVLQADAFNQSRISTVIVAAITSNLALAQAPGNVRLSPRESQLPRASVVNVSQLLTLDKRYLVERVGELADLHLKQVETGLKQVLSL